jgi:LysM repeat protein
VGRKIPWRCGSALCITVALLIGGCTREKPMPTPTPTVQAEPELAAPSPTAPPVSTPERPKPAKYTVQAGDTVWGIAQRFGITPQALVDANSLSEPDRLQPGQELVIPAAEEATSGDVPTGEPASVETMGAEGPRMHVVSAGDNLWDIARQYGTTVDEIVGLNELDPEGVLALGQELLIPQAAEERDHGQTGE